ncbi:MAG: transcriptional repressor NrdR [Burkholderiales bacterium]|nr:transcriptional repressor NrdR [Burkholderiales bacterium]
MRCPFCTHPDTAVVDSREADDGAIIRRRRRCLACDKRFTTYERVELRMPVLVKKSGARTDYDREKLRASFKLALRKRDVPADRVDEAIARIEERLIAMAEREVSTQRVGEMVMRELRKLDKIAYIRFASVYRNFEDPGEFEDVVAELTPARRGRRG